MLKLLGSVNIGRVQKRACLAGVGLYLVLETVVLLAGTWSAPPEGPAVSGIGGFSEAESLFPLRPGNRWTYELSGDWYERPQHLVVEVKGLQAVPRLQKDVMVVDETHPGVDPKAPRDVLPVLYSLNEGYLVRNTNHVYANDDRSTMVATAIIGESFAPVLPMDPEKKTVGWKNMNMGRMATMSELSTLYRVGRAPEAVIVNAGKFEGCIRAETKIERVSGRGFLYSEWYAPAVGMVKSVTKELPGGRLVEKKELLEMNSTPAS